MLARVITLRFDAVLGSFDDVPLRDFLKDKEVFAIREHFFVKNEVPYLVVMVTYAPQRPETIVPPVARSGDHGSSWRGLVTEAELPLFNTLRDWRLERSKQEGVPPYVICTNRQLTALVKTRPQSLAKLAEVEGFGKAKRDKYGQAMLGILARSAEGYTPPPPAHEGTTDEPTPA